MIAYRKRLELYAKGITQRSIASNTGHSRDKISDLASKNEIMKSRFLSVSILSALVVIFLSIISFILTLFSSAITDLRLPSTCFDSAMW